MPEPFRVLSLGAAWWGMQREEETMPSKAIMPTFHCFDNALDFISNVLIQNPDDRDALVEELLLVHGICLAPDGHPYAHAWVEDGNRCIFCGILDGETGYFATTRGEYYAETRVQEVTRYSVREALAHNKRTNHYGPWKEQYRALCGREETPRG